MKERIMNKPITTVLLALLMVLAAATVMANPVSTWNHRSNPALLGTSNRPIFETGITVAPGFSNSYFTTHHFADPTLVIDFDDIVDTIGDNGFRVGSTLRASAHSTAHLFGIGAGAYADVNTVFRLAVPRELFELVAQGNEIGQVYSGSGDVLLQSFAEYGAYLGYRYKKNYHLGLKIARYVPLAYAQDSTANFSFLADDDGTLSASAEVQAKLFSAFDLENLDAIASEEIMEALTGDDSGVKIDLGLVHNPDRNKPKWGVSAVNIPLAPAMSRYGWNFTASTAVSAENLLDSFLNEEEPAEGEESAELYDLTEPDPQFDAIVDSEEIFMPFRLGGFYRFTFLPLIDVIPHAELVFGEPFRLSSGVSVEGSFWPLSWISAGVSYDEINWKSSFGLRLNLHVLEIETQASLTSPELLGMFSSNGFALNLVFSLGL